MRPSRLLFLFTVLLLGNLVGNIAGANDELSKAPANAWTTFRGTLAGTGNSAARLPGKLELLWTFDTKDAIEATAAIADGVVYFPTMDGRFYALGLADGKERWKFAAEQEDPAKSSPCVAGDVVCYGDDLGVLRAIDRATGKLRWKLETDAEIISSPTFLDGKVLVGSYDSRLYCMNARDGQIVWKAATDGPVHCSPSIVNGQAAIAGCDGFLRFIAIADGKEAKAHEIGGNIASTPAFFGSRMFLGTMNNQVIAMDTEGMKVLWEYEDPKSAFEFSSSAALSSDLVVIGGKSKKVYALEQATGKERWTFRSAGRVESSPVIVGDRVYVGSSDGKVYGLELATGKKVWEFVCGPDVVASPAVADGRLVIGDTEGKLYCFGTKE